MDLIRQLRDARQVERERLESIRDQLAQSGRTSLNDVEQREWDAAMEEIKALDSRLEEVLDMHEREAVAAGYGRRASRGLGGQTTALRGVDQDGHEHAILRRDERLTDLERRNGRGAVADPEPLSFGKYIRGLVTGKWDGAERERRAQSEGSLGGGGHLVPVPLADFVIDKARAKTRVIQAGALTVPMDSQTLKIGRITGDPVAAWHAENAAITDSTMAFDAVTFTAQTLLAVVKSSVEVFEDATLLDRTLEDAFAAAIAVELDRVALRGSGTPPEPRGVLNQSGVAIATPGGANGGTPTWDQIVDSAIAPIQDANFDPAAIIWAPRTARTLAKAKDSQNRYLDPPTIARELPKLATTQIPVNLTTGTSTDTSEIYTGEWEMLAIGIRSDFDVKLVDQAYLASNYQFAMVAAIRADIQLFQPGAFSIVKGVRP